LDVLATRLKSGGRSTDENSGRRLFLDPWSPGHHQMIFAIISIAWLSIASLVVVACRMAASGDRAMASVNPVHERVVVHQRARWQSAPVARTGRPATTRSSLRRRPPSRGSRCVTGS
jgi:hypothetical protein